MREVVLINSKTQGAAYGVGTYIMELIYCLQESGIKVTVVELGLKIPEFTIDDTGELKKLQFPHLNYNEDIYYSRIASFLKLYIRNSPNVVFHFNFQAQKKLMQQIRTKFSECKIVFTVHYFEWSAALLGDADMYRQFIANIDNKLSKKDGALVQAYRWEKEVFETMDKIVALSNDTSSLLTDAYDIPQEKIFQTSNGLRDACLIPDNRRARLRKQYHIDNNEIVLLYVGRFDAVKAVDSLLASFTKIIAKHKNCRMVLVGDGDTSVLKSHSAIMSKVVITGKIDKKDVYKWYTIADIGLFPSLYEECSYVGIEMMMHSLPVVASDGYSVKNMFHDGQNALVAQRGRTKNKRGFEKNLFDNISLMIESKELRDRIGAEGRKTYEEKYSTNVMRQRYKQLIDSI
jgi:glycosyltransferase